MASHSGVTVLVVFGLLALAASSDPSCTMDEEPEDADAGEEVETCDGVVAVESPSGPVHVPGATGVTAADDSARCRLEPGGGAPDAVIVLQNALVRCNGQEIVVDGAYGPQTAQAVTNVQQRHGVPATGTYDPATFAVMQWPGTATSGVPECVGDLSPDAVVDDAS